MSNCTHHWTVTSECPMCLRADLAAARGLLLDIKADPHGCRFCDDGVLRTPNNPDKDHDPGCVWPRIDAFLAKEKSGG